LRRRGDRHAGGGRRVPRRIRARAGGRARRGRGAAVCRRGGRAQMHASWRQHGGPAPRRSRSLAGGELKLGSSSRHHKSGAWIEFQLQENSFLDTREKHGEAKRSFYHARRDYIYFPYRGSVPMDAIDRKILALLQEDASHSVAEIGSLVGLSSTPCWKRI